MANEEMATEMTTSGRVKPRFEDLLRWLCCEREFFPDKQFVRFIWH